VIATIIALFACQFVQAQRNIRDSNIVITAIGAQAGLNVPAGDLADRFGNAAQVGGQFMLKLKNNWMFQVDGTYFFGRTVKEDSVFKNFTTSTGLIIGRGGNPAELIVMQRGYTFMLSAGKIFPWIGPNPNSGIHLSLGAGFMEHKLFIRDEFGEVPQLEGEYIKGYDRLTNGFALRQTIGYQHFSNYRYFNYFIGLEFTEGFTRNRRDLNFDTMQRDNSQRIDIFCSLVARWYFPFYKRQPKEFYFY